MSNDFTAEACKLPELVGNLSQGLRIPIYQREYAWGRDEVDRLFSDLGIAIDKHLAKADAVMFLGTAIFAPHPIKQPKGSPAPQLDIIDGQQRITTFLVASVYICQLIESVLPRLDPNASPVDYEIVQVMSHTLDRLYAVIEVDTGYHEKGSDSLYRYKPRVIRSERDQWGNSPLTARYDSFLAKILWSAIMHRHEVVDPQLAAGCALTDQDEIAVGNVRRAVDRLLSDESSVDLLLMMVPGPVKSSKLRKALEIIGIDLDGIRNPKLGSASVEAVRLLSLSYFLMDVIELIDVQAPDEDYAFELFEPLNSTGLDLTPIETLKPLVVHQASGTYTGSTLENLFSTVESSIPNDRRMRSRWIREFLIFFALSQTGKKLEGSISDQRRYLRDAFSSVSAINLSACENFLSDMSEAALFQAEIWDGQIGLQVHWSEFDRLCMSLLRDSQHRQARAIIFRYWVAWCRNEIGIDEFRKILAGVAAFWVGWRGVGGTSGIDDVYRKLFSEGKSAAGVLPLKMEDVTSPPPAGAVIGVLRSNLNSRVLAEMNRLGLSDGGSLGSNWVTLAFRSDAYDQRISVTKFLLLLAYNDAVFSGNVAPFIIDGNSGAMPLLDMKTWDQDLTIEHIAPQSGAASSYDPAIYQDTRVNRIGNLTILPREVNSSLGKRSFPDKKELLAILQKPSRQERAQLISASNLPLTSETVAFLTGSEFFGVGQDIVAYGSSWTKSDVDLRGERLVQRAWKCLDRFLS